MKEKIIEIITRHTEVDYVSCANAADEILLVTNPRPDEVGVDYKYPIPYCPNCGMDGRMIYLHFKEHTNKEE